MAHLSRILATRESARVMTPRKTIKIDPGGKINIIIKASNPIARRMPIRSRLNWF